MFSIEVPVSSGQAPKRYETANAAIRAVNQLYALKIEGFVIRDASGAILTERQLAMLVMEQRLRP